MMLPRERSSFRGVVPNFVVFELIEIIPVSHSASPGIATTLQYWEHPLLYPALQNKGFKTLLDEMAMVCSVVSTLPFVSLNAVFSPAFSLLLSQCSRAQDPVLVKVLVHMERFHDESFPSLQ